MYTYKTMHIAFVEDNEIRIRCDAAVSLSRSGSTERLSSTRTRFERPGEHNVGLGKLSRDHSLIFCWFLDVGVACCLGVGIDEDGSGLWFHVRFDQLD